MTVASKVRLTSVVSGVCAIRNPAVPDRRAELPLRLYTPANELCLQRMKALRDRVIAPAEPAALVLAGRRR